MSRDGSGNYSLPAGNPVVTGSTISTTWANNTLSDIASALTASIAKDGQTVPSANLPMGGYRHTDVDDAIARTDYCTAGQAQDNSLVWLSSVSGTDTITATAAIGMAAYAAGQTFRFVAANTNTGAVTININSLGAKSITKNGTTALEAGDIVSGAVCVIVYDGTQFQLISRFSVLETTFTPVVADASSGGNTATTGGSIGRIIKIGKSVTVSISLININTTGMTAGNQVFIRGLPNTSVTVTNHRMYSGAVGYGNVTVTTGLRGYVPSNATYIAMQDGGSNMTVSQITSGTGDLYLTVTYEAAT